MDKEEAILFLKNDHQKLKEAIEGLSSHQMTQVSCVRDWTLKDVLAHISAWNWEEIKAVDIVLTNKKPWYVGLKEDEFNQREIDKRKSWSLDKTLKEWRDSFLALIKKLEKVTAKEWNFKTDCVWPNGTPLTMNSLFDYEYEREGHEGGHAKQIKKVFKVYGKNTKTARP